jgi:hypothetical protein
MFSMAQVVVIAAFITAQSGPAWSFSKPKEDEEKPPPNKSTNSTSKPTTTFVSPKIDLENTEIKKEKPVLNIDLTIDTVPKWVFNTTDAERYDIRFFVGGVEVETNSVHALKNKVLLGAPLELKDFTVAPKRDPDIQKAGVKFDSVGGNSVSKPVKGHGIEAQVQDISNPADTSGDSGLGATITIEIPESK